MVNESVIFLVEELLATRNQINFNCGHVKLFMTEGLAWFDRQVGKQLAQLSSLIWMLQPSESPIAGGRRKGPPRDSVLLDLSLLTEGMYVLAEPHNFP